MVCLLFKIEWKQKLMRTAQVTFPSERKFLIQNHILHWTFIIWQQTYRNIADLNLLELITVFLSAVYLITCTALSCLAAGLVAVVRPGQQQGGRSSARAQTQSNCGCHGLRSSARHRRCEHQPAGTGQPQPELTSSTVSDTQYQCGGAGGGGQLVQCDVEAVVMLWGWDSSCVLCDGGEVERPGQQHRSARPAWLRLGGAERRGSGAAEIVSGGWVSAGPSTGGATLGTGTWPEQLITTQPEPFILLLSALQGGINAKSVAIIGVQWWECWLFLLLSQWQFTHWKEYAAI